MKFSYLYSVDKNDGNGAQGSEKFVQACKNFLPAQGAKNIRL